MIKRITQPILKKYYIYRLSLEIMINRAGSHDPAPSLSPHLQLLKILHCRIEHAHLIDTFNILIQTISDSLGVTHFSEYSSIR